MTKLFWRRTLALVCVFLAMFGCCQAAVLSEERNARVVRVGYLFSEGYQMGGEGEYKTGFGYEYYQKISYYTGWKYEYVYGDFGELLEMLKSGEIDIMGNLSYTIDRAEYIDFSRLEQGSEGYYLFTLSDWTEVSETDYSALEGKKVGISKGSLQLSLFREWCARNGVNCEIIEYADKTSRENDFMSGAIDATVTTRLLANEEKYSNWRSAVKIGESPYYFGVSKMSDPSIIPDLNNALELIFKANYHYFDDLYSKYFSGKLLNSDFYTDEEQAWLHDRAGKIKIGYMDGYLPYSDADENGEMSGLVSNIADMVNADYEAEFTGVAFESYSDMYASLMSGEVDMIFPVCGDYWAAEQQDMFISNTVTTGIATMIYEGAYSGKKATSIAISEDSPFQRYYAAIYCPDAELVMCDTLEDCLSAVRSGEADSTLALRRHFLLNCPGSAINSMSSIELAETMDVCFGVRGGNTALLSICDKWLQVIGDRQINQAMMTYSNVDRVYTIKDYIAEHSLTFVLALLGFSAFIASAAVLYSRTIRRHNKVLTLATEAAEDARSQAESAAADTLAALEKLRHQTELARQWQVASETDALTGLINRGAGEQRVRHMMQNEGPGLFCIFDIDKFKSINDTFGHQTGDAALQAVAQCMRAAFRDGDVLIRFGGDEYAVLMPGVTSEFRAREYMNAFIAALTKTQVAGMKGRTLSLSMGIKLYKGGADFDEIYNISDAALYKCKNDPHVNMVFC